MLQRIMTLAFLIASHALFAQKTEIWFDVFLKGENIGKIHATEVVTGNTVVRDIQSKTDAKVLAFSIHVESDTKISKGGEVMTEGVAYRHANRGAEDVHGSTKRIGPKKYERIRNDSKSLWVDSEINFCVADLYFKEPKGLSQIYSNMWAEMVSVKSMPNGVYQITSPDKKISSYSYKNGRLLQIEVETPVGKVLSKRK